MRAFSRNWPRPKKIPHQVRFDVGVCGNTSHVLDAVDVWEELKSIKTMLSESFPDC